jgi:hypothetical protein
MRNRRKIYLQKDIVVTPSNAISANVGKVVTGTDTDY